MNRIVIKAKRAIRKIYNLTIRQRQINAVNKETEGKIENNLIAFECFFGRSIADNPKAIYDALDKNKYKCIFIVNNPENHQGYNTVKRNTKEHYRLIRKAKIIVNNQRMPDYWKKQKEQVFIQTWHGTPLKKLVHDLTTYNMPSAGTLEQYLKMFDQDIAKWDYLYSSCPFATEKVRSAFNYDKEILEIGYPRNNFLYTYTNNDVKRIKNSLNIPLDKKVILYAPTYRDDQSHGTGKYYFNTKLDFKLLKEAFPDYEIVIRYHYIITQSNDYNNPNIINATKYPDINDLYIISDILITDYSSVFFDYSILKKPFFFFTPDIDKYKDDLRGFYLDMNKDLVTKPAQTTQGLINLMKKKEQYNFDEFSNTYNPSTNKDSIKKTIEIIDSISKNL